MDTARTDYRSSAASIFVAHARGDAQKLVVAARFCEVCGLTYACMEGGRQSGVCPICQNTKLAVTTTRETLPGKWSEYLDAYIGECLEDGAPWVAVAQQAAPECACYEKIGDNPACKTHPYGGK
jgi:hypothetical protein